MAKTILVCGYGPGISSAIAEKFGRKGFAVALVARNAQRLADGVKALTAKGIKAAAFNADLADPASAAAVVGEARESLGPIAAIHWSAYSGAAGDLFAADAAEIRGALDIAITGLVATVKAALADLKKADMAAILITNGGFGKIAQPVDAIGVQYNAMGLSIANAAKDKLTGLLSEKLKGDGVFVGQVMVNGVVKGTAFDQGAGSLEPSAIAEKFWALYQARTDVRAEIGG